MTGTDDTRTASAADELEDANENGSSERDRHRVGRADELDDGERVIVDVDGIEIAVFDVDGEYHAVLNYCVHQGGPACEGALMGTLDVDDSPERALSYERDGRVVSCPWHGWEFDVTTGEHIAPTGYELPTYDVVVDDGDLYLVV